MKQPELGKIVLELRKRKRLTQSELAEACKLSLRTVQRIESGEVIPRLHTEKVILSFLGYDSNENSKTRLQRLLIQFKDLFNLKTNTMKKVSILSSITLISLLLFILLSTNAEAQSIEGWGLSGSQSKSYTIGLDKSTFISSPKSAYLKSKEENIKGFGTLMQTSSAKNYLGKRVKMTGYIKTENVKNRAGMWFRVDSKSPRKTLEFDNMSKRPIKGTTDWKKYEIVLDVPFESEAIAFGVLLNGTGKVWFDKVQFEIVDTLTETTAKKRKLKSNPTNLDF